MTYTHHSRIDALRDETRSAATFTQRVRSFLANLIACVEVARQRRALQHLDSHLLRDIGVGPADANREITRSFWDIPHGQCPER